MTTPTCCAPAGRLGHRLRSQGAIHPGDLPAQFPVGPRPPTRIGSAGSCWPGPVRLGPEGRRAVGPSTWTPPSARPTVWPRGGGDHGYTGQRGYHPLLAIAAGTGDVLMARLRKGRANTVRGAAHFLRETVGRAYATAGPGDNSRCGLTAASTPTPSSPSAARWMCATPLTVRQQARLRNIIEAIPETDWTPIPYWMDGAADVAETTYVPFQDEPDAAPVRLIVRRVQPTPGSQLALFASYRYHGCITDRDGDTLELEADHRRHAEIENAIRDLKYGVGLNHLP